MNKLVGADVLRVDTEDVDAHWPWDRLVTFYQFPREHWRHRRTSNPMESPFAAVRLRTAASTLSPRGADFRDRGFTWDNSSH